ncbi:hypothetical protein K431DRAFT_299237 [Polychaeton citri CBS 116435]|uniref:PHD-type domain-containing protein n=1 Tax=Polychaeton citri CBS 116435 TaxID=1314669 RepID=A0A9P4QI12_9PEZI|nr:hypothetical protein K431DRAFT_299237 [Polychaeton citri CBS 116435]
MSHVRETDVVLPQDHPAIREQVAAMNLVSMRSANSGATTDQGVAKAGTATRILRAGNEYQLQDLETRKSKKRRYQDDSDSGFEMMGGQEVDNGKDEVQKNVQQRHRKTNRLGRPASSSISLKIDDLCKKDSSSPVRDNGLGSIRYDPYLADDSNYDDADEEDHNYDEDENEAENEDDDIVCICKIRFNAKFKTQDPVIGCDGPCGQWYHPQCIGEKRSCEYIAETLEHWICSSCKVLGYVDTRKVLPRKMSKKGTAVITKKSSDIPERKSAPTKYR